MTKKGITRTVLAAVQWWHSFNLEETTKSVKQKYILRWKKKRGKEFEGWGEVVWDWGGGASGFHWHGRNSSGQQLHAKKTTTTACLASLAHALLRLMISLNLERNLGIYSAVFFSFFFFYNLHLDSFHLDAHFCATLGAFEILERED